jgi:hypothetical protein
VSAGESEHTPNEHPEGRYRRVPAEWVAEAINEAIAGGRLRNAAVKQFLFEAASPDASGLSARGTERPEGLEWLRVEFVQSHPDDRQEMVRLLLYPVVRDGRVFIEARRFDKEDDPSGNRELMWEDEIRRANNAEIERLRGGW